MTVDCPLDCEYLRDARKHDRHAPAVPDQIPNRDINVSEEFVQENEMLLMFLNQTILKAALEIGAIDYDVREALESLIKTYRTLESGLIYESRPANPLAANICHAFQIAVSELRQAETERGGLARTRDKAILGILAFLQRLEFDYNNGRKRGRAFIDFLREIAADLARQRPAEEGSSPLLL